MNEGDRVSSDPIDVFGTPAFGPADVFPMMAGDELEELAAE